MPSLLRAVDVWDVWLVLPPLRGEEVRVSSEADKRLIEMMWRWHHGLRLAYDGWRAPEDELRRKVIVTPYEGAYGPAGAVITIEGSPPHGTLIVNGGGFTDGPVVFIVNSNYRSRHPVITARPHTGILYDVRQAALAVLQGRGIDPKSLEG